MIIRQKIDLGNKSCRQLISGLVSAPLGKKLFRGRASTKDKMDPKVLTKPMVVHPFQSVSCTVSMVATRQLEMSPVQPCLPELHANCFALRVFFRQ